MRDRPAHPARIADLALIGDLHTAALVDVGGRIGWLCLPTFSSSACFAALLDTDDAGHWTLRPRGRTSASSRRYRDDTLVLETRWTTPTGTVQVVDLMPPRGEAAAVVRIVECLTGQVAMACRLRLRFDDGSRRPWVRRADGAVGFVAGPDAAWLRADVPLELADRDAPERRGEHEADVTADFVLAAGERASFVLSHRPSYLPAPPPVDAGRALADTTAFWTSWTGRTEHEGPYRAEVRRSLVLLKALTFAPTGGVLAAATTSLPERLGGARNWDYRYCWLRDATFTLQALIGCGHLQEAAAWREWLVRAVAGDPARLQIMYGLDGSRRLPERTLDGLAGFAGSRPVRVGNAASDQRQLDVWGEVLDGLNLAREAGLPADDTVWELQRGLLDWLEGHWREPDNGLWEVRGPRRHFVHSQVMAWAGLDRAVRAVERHGLTGPVDRWRSVRDEIHREVCARGYDERRGTFTQSYGSRGVDAALLLLPRVGFLPWHDERVRGTVAAVERELLHDGLVWRYDADAADDGVGGGEGAFLACSFWLADARHALGDRVGATALFERLLACRNDVGMLSEEYDPVSEEQLGNTPQAFSLVGLVNTARHLGGGPWHTAEDPRRGAPAR